MRVYLFDKFLIRHLSFFFLEIKSALFLKLPTRGNFKLLKRLYVRFVVNYIESIKYYLFHYSNKEIDNLYLNKDYKLKTHGIEFLDNQNLNLIDFLKYNNNIKPNIITTNNEIDYEKGELYARDRGFHKLARNYLQVSNCNFNIASWNTFPFDKDEQLKTSLWHRDRDGIKLVKIFIYLSDVNSECGPHFFILGSHKKKPLRFVPQFRYRDKTVKKYFKNENIIEIFGNAGTCFIEDTSGFHRGSKPINNNKRSILCLTYFTGPVYYEKNCKYINLF